MGSQDGFTVKDSGVREEFASGMRRDTQEGKTLWSLVYTGPMLERWAEHLTKGAKKYDRDNWTHATGEAELQRFRDSAARHFAQWMRGDRDEDHAAAVFFNLNGAEYVLARMKEKEQAMPVICDWCHGLGFRFGEIGDCQNCEGKGIRAS